MCIRLEISKSAPEVLSAGTLEAAAGELQAISAKSAGGRLPASSIAR